MLRKLAAVLNMSVILVETRFSERKNENIWALVGGNYGVGAAGRTRTYDQLVNSLSLP
jgi:hypothetical protein